MRNKEIGFVYQFHHLLPEFTALENISLPMLISGLSKDKAHKKSLDLLRRVNLDHRANHKPSELSGGERQRVTLARALVNDPAIVWADEPTGNLDSKNEHEIMDLLCDLNVKNNQTFVVVSHSQYVGGRTNRIINMKDGLII